MAEAALGHAVVGGELPDRDGRTGRRQHPLPHAVQQAIALAVRIAERLRQPFVRQHHLEQRCLDLESVAKVFVKHAPYEAHDAADQIALRPAGDRRPGRRDAGLEAPDQVRVTDADPRERPAGRGRREVIAVPRGHDGDEGAARRHALGGLVVRFEVAPPGQGQLQEDQRRIAPVEALHAVPVVAPRIRPGLDAAEVSVRRRPPRWREGGGPRDVDQMAQVGGPLGRRGRSLRPSGERVGDRDVEGIVPPLGGAARRTRAHK